MPEINPYEAPQSDASKAMPPPRPDGEGYPVWIGTAVNVQFGLILTVFILAMIITGPPNWFTEFLGLLIVIFFFSLSVGLLVAAIRYRIGWLLLIELTVLCLPIFALFRL